MDRSRSPIVEKDIKLSLDLFENAKDNKKNVKVNYVLKVSDEGKFYVTFPSLSELEQKIIFLSLG